MTSHKLFSTQPLDTRPPRNMCLNRSARSGHYLVLFIQPLSARFSVFTYCTLDVNTRSSLFLFCPLNFLSIYFEFKWCECLLGPKRIRAEANKTICCNNHGGYCRLWWRICAPFSVLIYLVRFLYVSIFICFRASCRSRLCFPQQLCFRAIYFDVSINFCIKYAHLSRGILWLISKEKRIKDSTQKEVHIYVPWRIICHSNHK